MHLQLVCNPPLTKRRRRSSFTAFSIVLFCCDAGLIQTVRNVVSVNREIQFLDQVNKYL